MSLTMTCRHCGTEVAADDEDTLVERVQAHASEHEGGGPTLSRDHILSRFHRLQAQSFKSVEPEDHDHNDHQH